MLYPSTKLLVCSAVVLLGAAFAYPVIPGLGGGLFLGVLLWGCLVVWDATRSLGLLDGISAEGPARFRLSRFRQGVFGFTLVLPTASVRTYRVGVPFPDTLACEEPEFEVTSSVENAKVLVEVGCRAVKRGLQRMESLYLETASPLGFWRFQSSIRHACEVQVFPDVLTERRRLGGLFARQGQGGVHAVRQLGKGKDFEKLREYVPGDDFQDIHWKATAKRNLPVTKVFQLERTQDTYVVLDASRLSERLCPVANAQTPVTTYLEKNLTVGLMLAQLAEQQGDHFGFFAYSDRVRHFLRAASGRAHFNACRDTLNRLEPSRATPDFRELLSAIRLRLHRRSLLILLVSLDDPMLMETFLENVDLIRRQHVVLVVAIRPVGARPVFSDDQVDSLDGICDALAGHEQWEALAQFQAQLRSRGIDLLLPEADQLGVEVVNRYLAIKKRQIL